jgi:lysophospholipase L1-like esterase
VGSLLLAAVSTLFTLALLEGAFRARAFLAGRKSFEAALTRGSRVTAGARASLGDLIRPSRHPDIVYELAADLRVSFLGAPLSTSHVGFRDRDYTLEKRQGSFRILGIGDSIMFGWGVGDGEDYLSLVESRLEAESPGRHVEIINLAVPGYNSVMEVATLREKGLRYAPDLVIVGLCGNDASLPNFLQAPPEIVAVDRSFLAEFIRARFGEESAEDETPGLVDRPVKAGWRHTRAEDGAQVPPRYAHMVGLPAFRRAMEELKQLSETHGFRVLLLYYPGAPGEMREIVADLGLPSLNTAPAVRRFLSAHGGGERALPLLHRNERDPHPSQAGHRLIADALVQYLAELHGPALQPLPR